MFVLWNEVYLRRARYSLAKISKFRTAQALNIEVRNIAYGPIGFTCKCGATAFLYEPKLIYYNGTKQRTMTRPESKCLGCGEKYIFVGPQ